MLIKEPTSIMKFLHKALGGLIHKTQSANNTEALPKEQHDWTQGRGKRKTVCTRQQLPLDLAWAISIHKSQGMTVGPEEAFQKLIVDCGSTEHWAPGLLYVAASRGVHRDCLAFDPVEINELGEITHMPFYNFNRFEKLNTSAAAELMFAYFERLKLKQP